MPMRSQLQCRQHFSIMFRYLVLAVILPVAIFAIKPLPCKSGGLQVDDARFEGCDELPCVIKNNSPLRFQVDFTPNRVADNLQAKLVVWLGALQVPYELPEDLRRACDFMTPACPLEVGTKTTYEMEYVVSAPISDVTVDIEVSLKDTMGEVLCLRVSAKLIA